MTGLRIHRNYQDPHHLNSKSKKKKDKDKEEEDKDKKQDKDIIFGDKDKDANKIQKKKINGHEWITFKDTRNNNED